MIDKYNVLDAKKECQKTVALAATQPWGIHLPWNKMYIMGGFIASHLQRQKPKDVDFYFEDDDAMDKAVAILTHPDFANYIQDVDPKYRETIGRDGKMITEWAITMKTGHSFITKHWGEPKDVKITFDYVHCCAHYEIATNQLFISEAQYVAATQKKLMVNNPLTFTNLREEKFLLRGYTK